LLRSSPPSAAAALVFVVVVKAALSALALAFAVVATATVHHLVVHRLRIQMRDEVAATRPLDPGPVHDYALREGVVLNAVGGVDGDLRPRR
jgi:hypothetical protein